MIKTRKVESYETRIYCDECGRELMLDGMLPTYPTKFQYICLNNCDAGNIIDSKAYPTIEYKTVEDV